MLKIIAVVLGLLFVGSVVSNYVFWGKSKEKIKKAETQLEDYRVHNQKVLEKGDSLEAIITTLHKKENNYKDRIDSLEKVVVNLKEKNEKEIRQVAQLFQPDDLVNEMRYTFPELKAAPIGVARVPHPETGFMIRTFQVPVQFVATFIADHKELANFREINQALGESNLTYKSYISLKDSIISLKEQKAEEYKRGLEYGLTRYENLMKEYISTLKNPPKIEWPSTTSIIAAGAAGIAAGVLIKK